MRTQSILLTLTSLFLSLTAAAPLAETTDAAAAAKTLARTSFGFDPLVIVQSGGNENVTSVTNDPANAHTGSGYLSLGFPDTTDKRYVVLVYGTPLANSTTYTASYWAKAPADSVCYGMLELRDQGSQMATDVVSVLLTKKYKKVQQKMVTTKVAKGDTGIAILSITCSGSGVQQAYVDDFVMTSS